MVQKLTKILINKFVPCGIIIVLFLTLIAIGQALTQPQRLPKVISTGEFKKFKSEQEFKDYLSKSQQKLELLGRGTVGLVAPETALGPSQPLAQKFAEPERVSQTNIQVKGIDEADIVKTDGKEIYFSSPQNFIEPLPIIQEQRPPSEETQKIEIFPPVPIPPRKLGGIKVVKAFPVDQLKVDSKIEQTGDLLLSENNLVIFSRDKIYGYNVSDPKSPSKEWEISLKENNEIIGSRLYKNKIYLVTKTRTSHIKPCVIEILSIGTTSFPVRCTDIYHPIVNVPVDSIYTVMSITPKNGDVEDVISFVGSQQFSTIYMSPNALYTTYYYFGDTAKFFYNFLNENSNLIPESILERVKKLQAYDISEASKITEITSLIDKYQNSQASDEKLKFQNNLQNRMTKYQKDHKRELEQTGIVKIGLDGLKILAHGSVTGKPLNQFSLDEFENNLRIAVTIGEGWWGLGFGARGETANDVYVLDKNLNIVGAVKDLGLKERIYSARFIESIGYIVTFRQTDPFYVLDLANPRAPKLAGELKIPGFSSYLHPISKNTILGVGMESSQVKLSLFDVSDPQNPNEIDKYILDEHWSEVSTTHHAFLQDKMHKIFFMPGSRGGYIFSYQNNKLSLAKAVSNIRARRAIYINDYLYIIGDDKIVVLSETTWEKVNELEF